MFGLVSSYLRMSWKVANYNNLRDEVETLRDRYQRLEKEAQQKGVQLASLQVLASEVSVAFGIKRMEGPLEMSHEGRLIPTMRESLEEYNFLKSASLSRVSRRGNPLFQTNGLPSIWPVEYGRLMSNFGHRSDPFSGEGAFHAGVDISAKTGTPVKATADGIVASAEWAGAYGKLVILDHGNGIQTYYAHLSRMDVVEGQWIRRGEILGRAGATGRVTSSHLHYEVRRRGAPMNPSPYLKASLAQSQAVRHEYGF